MLTGKRLSYSFAVLLYLFFMGNVAHAASSESNSGLQVMQGKINTINTSHNSIVVDDMSYTIGADIAVVTPAGHKGRVGMLYPGKRVRILVDFNTTGNTVGTIHKVYLLR